MTISTKPNDQYLIMIYEKLMTTSMKFDERCGALNKPTVQFVLLFVVQYSFK